MELFQGIRQGIITNTEPPITRIVSTMDFTLQKCTNYNELVRTYDQNLINHLKHKEFFNEKIIIVEVQMMPEDMHWIIWKNLNEISQFLSALNQEIQAVRKVSQFKLDRNGKDTSFQIDGEFMILKTQFQRGIANFTENLAFRFVNFLNRLGEQLYLRKTVAFLTFVGHCISIDKWPIMIHLQLFIYKSAACFSNKIIGFFKPVEQTNKQVDYFVTVTSDGILVSDDHLLLSKVKKMMPFTNQMKIKCYLNPDDDFIYDITSGRIDSLRLNFHKDYIAGTNFGCGLGRALKYSGYNFLMGLNVQSEQNIIDINNIRTTSNLNVNRFQSYAQIRQKSNCKMYSDGCGYFQDLHNELMKAEKQVCITGWMITPYFKLKRPSNINDDEYRLDGVLRTIAERGVKIFIIVFMEPSLLVNNDSQHVQKHFEDMHKNIKVYRHPNVAVPQLWSHHQKLVVIDQKIGFMGGLDICYGRWDTHQHRLIEDQPVADRRFWDGCQFNNYRLKDIYEPRVYWKTNLNKDFQPRMPFHDIAVQIRGDVVVDLLRHFVQYWYFVKSQLSTDPRKYLNLFQKRLTQALKSNQSEAKMQSQYIFNKMKNDTQQTLETKFNAFKQKVGIVVSGDEQRISELLIEQRTGMNAGDLSIQMLRSASQWSIGLDIGKFQCSIHNAYQSLIQNSESHIYIENQFFMGLKNKIVESLANRIIRAKKENKKFRVVAVMPLLPGFQGYIADPTSTVLRIQMHWQYQAISRGKDSLHQRLFANGFSRPQIDEYVYFFGLRKGEVLNQIPVTEIIYVHSKLMIVDDKKMIVGSANINDRSLLGTRDSQIAICIEDHNGTHAGKFRKEVIQEHWGLNKNDNANFMDDQVWTNMKSRAKRNTQIFRSVFACLPDDKVETIAKIECFQQQQADISRWFSLVNEVRGHVVDFPLQFLSKEDLTFKMNQVQFYAPDHTFT